MPAAMGINPRRCRVGRDHGFRPCGQSYITRSLVISSQVWISHHSWLRSSAKACIQSSHRTSLCCINSKLIHNYTTLARLLDQSGPHHVNLYYGVLIRNQCHRMLMFICVIKQRIFSSLASDQHRDIEIPIGPFITRSDELKL